MSWLLIVGVATMRAMAMTQTEAQTMLDRWIAAELAVTSGQAYAIGEVQVTRANLFEIQKRITYWQSVVESFAVAAAGGTSRTTLATFGSPK